MTETPFTLDPRLVADTLPLAQLLHSELLLMNDSRFPWLILVPRIGGAVEMIDLDPASRAGILREVEVVTRALRAATACHKLNTAALGNQVRQLHIHIIARFETDAAWPRPVWGVGTAEPYAPEAAQALMQAVRALLTVQG